MKGVKDKGVFCFVDKEKRIVMKGRLCLML